MKKIAFILALMLSVMAFAQSNELNRLEELIRKENPDAELYFNKRTETLDFDDYQIDLDGARYRYMSKGGSFLKIFMYWGNHIYDGKNDQKIDELAIRFSSKDDVYEAIELMDALLSGGSYGRETGDPNASGYYGIGRDGTGGNHRLGNRRAITRPIPEYDCNEEGKVVVTISVDQSGKVISAQPGATGTTNSASCLLSRAKEAALRTKFNADSNAPAKQVGQIIYNFSLSE